MLILLRSRIGSRILEEIDFSQQTKIRRRDGKIFSNYNEDLSHDNLISFQAEHLKHNFREIEQLPPEWSFGELALISNKKRSATIRSKTDWYFAILEKDDYQKIYGTLQAKKLSK